MLKMGIDYTREERLARVDQVIIDVRYFNKENNQFKSLKLFVLKLNLIKAQDTYIGMGDLLKGISGGEKRRLAFASEVRL